MKTVAISLGLGAGVILICGFLWLILQAMLSVMPVWLVGLVLVWLAISWGIWFTLWLSGYTISDEF